MTPKVFYCKYPPHDPFTDKVMCPWADIVTPPWSPWVVAARFSEEAELRAFVLRHYVLASLLVASVLLPWAWYHHPHDRVTKSLEAWPIAFASVAAAMFVAFAVNFFLLFLPSTLVVIAAMVISGAALCGFLELCETRRGQAICAAVSNVPDRFAAALAGANRAVAPKPSIALVFPDKRALRSNDVQEID